MPELLRMPEVATGTDEAHLTAWAVAENQNYAATDVIVHVETAKAAVDVEAEFAATSTGNGRIFASPIARRLAKDAKLNLEQLTGTGPGGRIVRSDVTRAITRQSPPQPAVLGTPVPAPAPSPAAALQPQPGEGWTEVPHTKLRKLIATRLTESKTTIPHFYLRASVRADRLLTLRAELNEALPVRISVNDLILKAVATAHTQVPDANVVWTETGLRKYDSVNLGVAIASPRGLVTPVVANVERLSIGTLAETTRDLARRAAEGQLKQAELEGGTSTVSNLGMYGTEEFTAIINPPQSSILAVGAALPEPDVNSDGKVEVRTKIHVVLCVDHRAIDGALAAQWMSAFRDAVETPLRLLG